MRGSPRRSTMDDDAVENILLQFEDTYIVQSYINIE